MSCSDDRTTDTEDAAIAADPIQGCSTMPRGMKTPAEGDATLTLRPRGERRERAHHEGLSKAPGPAATSCAHVSTGQGVSELGSGGRC